MKSLNAERIIVSQLRADFLHGAIAPGTLLLQSDLAHRFNVSRFPVRDAIKALEADGLVKVLANRTAVVTRLDACEIDELFSIRRILECDLIALSAERATADDLRNVRQSMLHLLKANSFERGLDAATDLRNSFFRPACRPLQLAAVERYRLQTLGLVAQLVRENSHRAEMVEGVCLVAEAYIKSSAADAVSANGQYLTLVRDKLLSKYSQNGA